jgi:hypothetical protein
VSDNIEKKFLMGMITVDHNNVVIIVAAVSIFAIVIIC